MAIELCKCANGLGNTGLPSSDNSRIKIPVGMFRMNTYNSVGVKNRVAGGTGPISQVYLDGRLNDPDPTQRWYPIMDITSVATTRSEDVTVSLSNGVKEFIKEGIRSFPFEIGGGATMAGQLKQGRCTEFSFFLVDECNKLIGMDLGDTYLTPIRAAKGTFSVGYNFASDSPAREAIPITFDWHAKEKDENLAFLESDADLADARGLLDISSTVSSISTTGFTVKLFDKYGPVGDKGVLTGLLVGDFALHNVTDNLAVTITSVTESTVTKGTYVFVIPAQGTTEVLRLTPSKDGFDFSQVIENTIAIPV